MGSTYDKRDMQCDQCGRSYVLVTNERDYPNFEPVEWVASCPQGHETTLTLSADTSVSYSTYPGNYSAQAEWKLVSDNRK